MRQPTLPALLRTVSAPTRRQLTHQRSFTVAPALHLWNGTTEPFHNQTVQPHILSPAVKQNSIKASSQQSTKEAEEILRTHTKFIEDLLSRATSSDGRSFSSKPTKASLRERTRQHSLSEPPLFRTDGPLTPYPVKLDTGEELEPKHATLVRIFDKGGQARSIVVAEVDEDDTGRQRSILLALDLKEWDGEKGGAVGRRISAEEMYTTLGLEKA